MLLLCMAVLVQGCGVEKQQEKQVAYEFYYSKDYWELMSLEDSYYESQEKLEETIQNYIAEIEKLLGISAWWTEAAPNAETVGFAVQISESGPSWAYKLGKSQGTRTEATLILNLGNGSDGAAAHELTHIMIDADFTFSRSLEEGLCNYVQSKVGQDIDIEKYNWDLEEYLNSYIYITESFSELTEKDLLEVKQTIGTDLNGYPYGITTTESSMWYAYSQSFVTYLIRMFSTEKVVQLIQNGVDERSYETYLGKPFKEIKADWLAYYDESKTAISKEEIGQALKEHMGL